MPLRRTNVAPSNRGIAALLLAVSVSLMSAGCASTTPASGATSPQVQRLGSEATAEVVLKKSQVKSAKPQDVNGRKSLSVEITDEGIEAMRAAYAAHEEVTVVVGEGPDASRLRLRAMPKGKTLEITGKDDADLERIRLELTNGK